LHGSGRRLRGRRLRSHRSRPALSCTAYVQQPAREAAIDAPHGPQDTAAQPHTADCGAHGVPRRPASAVHTTEAKRKEPSRSVSCIMSPRHTAHCLLACAQFAHKTQCEECDATECNAVMKGLHTYCRITQCRAALAILSGLASASLMAWCGPVRVRGPDALHVPSALLASAGAAVDLLLEPTRRRASAPGARSVHRLCRGAKRNPADLMDN
jgi:hypothetical protein